MLILILAFEYTTAQMPEQQAIVMLKDDSSIEKIASFPEIKSVSCLSNLYHIYLVEASSAQSISRLIPQFKRLPNVVLAQPNHRVYLRSTTPNDPLFSLQWHLKNNLNSGIDIGISEVWDSTRGGITKTGDTIVLGMVEVGVDRSHPDLYSNFYLNHREIPFDLVDNDSNGYIDDYRGYNVSTDNDSMIDSDHGTSIAGIMGAHGDDSLGVVGINWNIKILPVLFSNSTEASVVKAYAYYAQVKKDYISSKGQKGAFVVAVNSSFGIENGNPADYPIWCAMYDSLGKLGIISVGATANSAVNTDLSYDMPTSCASHFLVMVTNHDADGMLHPGAAFGLRTIDIAAPGTDIYSTSYNGTYNSVNGTSFAAPMVTASVGLLYSGACASTIDWSKQNLSDAALFFKSILLNGSQKESNFTNTTQCGGRLFLPDAYKFLNTNFCYDSSFPTSSIYATQTQICVNEPTTLICLKNKSTQSIQWYINNSSAGHDDTLTFIKDTVGYYDITLITSGPNHYDTILLKKHIKVLSAPAKPTIICNASYLTTSGNNTVSWYDSSGNFLYKGINFYPTYSGKYYCMYASNNTCSATSDTFMFYGVSIGLPENNYIQILPNPANEDIYIYNKSEKKYWIEFRDITGRIVTSQKSVMQPQSYSMLNISQWEDGIYICKLYMETGEQFNLKLVKK